MKNTYTFTVNIDVDAFAEAVAKAVVEALRNEPKENPAPPASHANDNAAPDTAPKTRGRPKKTKKDDETVDLEEAIDASKIDEKAEELPSGVERSWPEVVDILNKVHAKGFSRAKAVLEKCGVARAIELKPDDKAALRAQVYEAAVVELAQ